MSLEHNPNRREELETRRAELVEELEGISANSEVPMNENDVAQETTARIVAIDSELEGLSE